MKVCLFSFEYVTQKLSYNNVEEGRRYNKPVWPKFKKRRRL